MRLISLVLLSSLHFLIIGCSRHVRVNNKTTSAGKINFDSSILLTHQTVVDLTAPDDIFAVSAFLEIYENPDGFYDDALWLMTRSDCHIEQKLIAIYSLQKSNLDSYVKFLKKSIRLFFEDKISEGLLNNVISAPIGKNYIIVKNYSYPKVREILSSLISSDKTSHELKLRLENILSGSVWENLQDIIPTGRRKK